MDTLLDLTLDFSSWLQDNFGNLEGFFAIISEFGLFETFLVAVTLVYWSVDKSLGITMGYLLVIANSVNATLKHALRDPRPYWIEPAVGLAEEESYGLPSGHAMSAMVEYISVALWAKKSWVWFLAILMVLLVGLSRIFLGVHSILDVAVGFALGGLILLAAYLWRRHALDAFAKRILGKRLMTVMLLNAALIIIYVVIVLLIGDTDDSVRWASRLEVAERESFDNATGSLGGLIGLSVGFVLEGSWVRFKSDGPLWKRVARYLIGVSVVLGIWFGLKGVLPEDPTWLSISLRAIQVLVLSFWVAYYAPWLFVKLRLADAWPKPEINISL